MKLIKKYGTAIFWGLLLLDCLLINFKPFAGYRIYTKPLLLIVLAVIFYLNTKRSKHSRSKTLVYLGLLFCWIGDWGLLLNDFAEGNKGDMLLFLGISFLLLGFTMYTLLFKKMTPLILKDCQEAFLAALAMVIVSTIFYSVINKENLLYFKPLIIVGIFVLLFMIIFAANIHHDKVRRNLSLKFFIPGTITLVIAMGIIIAHRFLLQEADFLPAVIELTYGFGQMLILQGFTKYLKA